MVDAYFADAELAALYDLFCPRSRRADYDFYLPMAMAARGVLDIGCGTGTFLHELRARGHGGRLVGLDPGAGMLAQARVRDDIEWVLGDLGAAGWRGAFDFAVMTGHAFQALVSDAQIAAALSAVARALSAGGRFGFETRNPRAREWERWNNAYRAEVADAAGRRVKMGTRIDAPFDGRTVTFTHTFSCSAWAADRESRSTLRFLDEAALDAALAQAGLAVEARYGDWDASPVSAASPELITVARRI